jgi:predicted PurR-regulated permease PerM
MMSIEPAPAPGRPGPSAPTVVLAGIAAAFALQAASSVVVPVVFALFIIAVVHPVQRRLERYLPRIVAALVTVLVAVAIVLALASLLTWGFGRAAQWLVGNIPRFQAIYARLAEGLEEQGFVVASAISDTFNVNWMLRTLQDLGGRAHQLTSFIVVTFVYVLLGLVEVDVSAKKILSYLPPEKAGPLIHAFRAIGTKMQHYMLVRTVMSVLTGLVVWAFALVFGLELATAWGAIAFGLNYIPFLGPLIATVFPTLFAFVQFESWQAALLVFVALNIIQFVIGSYLEPRVAGAALSISPFLVLFSVFFWAFLWGLPGAFIGVPVTIAALTLCHEFPRTRWLAQLMSEKAGAVP